MVGTGGCEGSIRGGFVVDGTKALVGSEAFGSLLSKIYVWFFRLIPIDRCGWDG